jgi:predicted secreted hydrolase
MATGADAFEHFDAMALEDLANLLWQPTFDAGAVPDEVAATFTRELHRPAAAGARMRRFLQGLIDHPVRHTADLTALYEAALPWCDELSTLQTYVLRNLLGKNANEGYEPVPESVELQFPRDHALKVRAQTGWHFFVGSAWDEHGTQYGVELMFFGIALFPPALAASFGMSDLDNQLIEIQLAISPEGQRHHQAAPIVVAGTSGLIEATSEPFSLRLGRNEMVSATPDELFPMRVRAWGLDRGEHPALELAVDLTFTSGKGILPQGDEGALPACDGVGTFYYSVPDIQIDPEQSSLRIGDREIRLTRGQFWFDHQWGYLAGNPRSEVMRAADNLTQPDPEGWDWFMAQFDGNRQVTVAAAHKRTMADQFYRQTGAGAPGPMDVRVGGKYMDGDGTTSVAWGSLRVTDWVKTEHSGDPERYPATHTWHPNGWSFVFDDLPDDIRSFTMVPIVEGGQSAFFANGAQICEGAVRLFDPSGRQIGNGFAESVAYADVRRNKLRLAGLPVTDELVERIEPKAPHLPTRLWNLAYVITHHKQLSHIMDTAKGLDFIFETADAAAPPG